MNKTGKLFPTLLACGICLISGTAWAQYIPPKFVPPIWRGQLDTTGLSSEKALPALNVAAVFTPSLIDNPPRFKGGEIALKRFLQKNLQVHPIFGRVCVEGWTRIKFVVDVDGRIRNPVVYKSLYWAWDDEVLRVVMLLNYRFEPATYNGELVASSYVLSAPFSNIRPLPFFKPD